MPRTQKTRKWSGLLAESSERDFERMVLPFFKLFWPDIQQTSSRKHLDSCGIDLFVWSDSSLFPCVVQCKGFIVKNLSNEQTYQVEKSIDDFIKSEYACVTYILIHNREPKHEAFNDKIRKKLDHLVSIGKAREAHLWDRQTALDKVDERVKEIIDSSLRNYSKALMSYFQSLFEFGYNYVSSVPVVENRLIFKRGEPCNCILKRPLQSREIDVLLSSPSDTRWTLLTGKSGAGKTTASLHAAATTDRVVLFVRFASLSGSQMNGTNKILESIIRQLKIFDDYEDQDKIIFEEYASPILAYFLRHPASKYILIMDGLDENRIFSDLRGLQYLSNSLAELSCPIILTTRSEHLNAMFGDFSLSFSEFSSRNAPYRDARMFELANWEKRNVIVFLEKVIMSLADEKKKRVEGLLDTLVNDKYYELYGELPFSPLFLQFILEDVIENGLRQSSRPTLLNNWVRRKIWRDRESIERLSVDDNLDINDSTTRIMEMMENISYMMCNRENDRYELSESIDSTIIEKEANGIFHGSGNTILSILLNSVLMPVTIRSGSKLNVAFSFKIFQEYFLAAYLFRKREPDIGYPESVRSFYSEMSLL